MRSPRSGPSGHPIRTRCSPRWARWRPPRPCLNGLAECGAVDLWKRCVDGGQAEGGAWGDRDRDRDGDRHRGGAGVAGERVAFGDGWIEARPTPTSAPAHKRRNPPPSLFKFVRYPPPPSLFKFVRYPPPSLFKFVRYPPPPYLNLLGTPPPPYSNLLGTRPLPIQNLSGTPPPSLFKIC